MPEGKRRVSRQLLTEFTVPQLRIIVNDLNGNIEKLNEHLVQILMERDELHMGQDSMLVDIEDLTRYLYVIFKFSLLYLLIYFSIFQSC